MRDRPWLTLRHGALVLCAIACAPEAPPAEAPAATDPPVDILLVTIDTLRADRVGCYGDPLAQTPTLDRLAAEGALFRQAHAVTPLTLPSHASILTGRYPLHHGLRDNAGFRLADDTPTLAAALKASGYHTAAFVSAFVLDSAWGLDAGFDVYRDPFHPADVAQVAAFGELELPGAEVINAAQSWWQQTPSPRFAWVHLYDPHTPWKAHPGGPADPYRGEVAFADGLIGRLLDVTGDNTLAVVTSDHGEGLWEGGEREHGVLLGPAVTRVPLIIRPPGGLNGTASAAEHPPPPADTRRPDGVDSNLALAPVPDQPAAARVVEMPVSGVDVAPTLADFAGVEFPADGRSLRAAVEETQIPERAIYAETFTPLFHHGWRPLTMAQTRSLRVERAAQDGQLTDRVWRLPNWTPAPATDGVALEEALTRWRGSDAAAPGVIDPETRAALEALGYTTSPAPETAGWEDPRDRTPLLAELAAADQLADPEQAIAALSAIISEAPGLIDARISRSLRRAEAGDLTGALEDTDAVLERWAEHPTALANSGLLARALGRPELALTRAQQLTALNPHDLRGYRLEAAVWVDREQPEEVQRIATAGLEVEPADPNLNYLLGLARIQLKDLDGGISALKAARAAGARVSDIDLWIGVAHERAARFDDARSAYEAAARARPDDLRPWAMAAWMLFQADRCEEARPFLVNLLRRGAGADPRVAQAAKGCGVGSAR